MHEYSKVEATSISVAGSPGGGPLIIRSRSTVTLGGTSSVSANGATGGPGAGNGGPGGTISGPGQPGTGPAGGLPSGGGGSYASKGGGNSHDPVGDAALSTLELPNRGSGGAGGNSNGSPSPGGAGGGGGGTIEITAAGPIVLGTVLARGGNGATGASLGGGGSGGTILVRSGASVSAMLLDATGGMGQNLGGVGRIRVDSGSDVPEMSTPVFYRGPMFAADTPAIVTEAQPTWAAIGQPLTPVRYYFTTPDRAQLRGPFEATFSSTGRAMLLASDALFEGLNIVCIGVEGGDLDRAEARNCIDVAYVP